MLLLVSLFSTPAMSNSSVSSTPSPNSGISSPQLPAPPPSQYNFSSFDGNALQFTPTAASRTLALPFVTPGPGLPLSSLRNRLDADADELDEDNLNLPTQEIDEDDTSPAAFLRCQERAKANAEPVIDLFLNPGGPTGTLPGAVSTGSATPVAIAGAQSGRKHQCVDNIDSDDEEPEGVRKKRLHDMACLIKNSIPLTSQSQSLLDMHASVCSLQ